MKSLWLKWMSVASLNLSQRNKPSPDSFYKGRNSQNAKRQLSPDQHFNGISVQNCWFPPCAARIKSNTKSQNIFLKYIFPHYRQLKLKQEAHAGLKSAAFREQWIWHPHSALCCQSFLLQQLVCFLLPFGALCAMMSLLWQWYHPIPSDLEL